MKMPMIRIMTLAFLTLTASCSSSSDGSQSDASLSGDQNQANSMMSRITGSSLPDAEKVKQDLIGQKIGDFINGPSWSFDSISEFNSLEITDQKSYGELAEMKAHVEVAGMTSGRRFSADLLLTYRNVDDVWQLVKVNDFGSLRVVQ